jgi:hypothetical protein
MTTLGGLTEPLNSFTSTFRLFSLFWHFIAGGSSPLRHSILHGGLGRQNFLFTAYCFIVLLSVFVVLFFFSFPLTHTMTFSLCLRFGMACNVLEKLLPGLTFFFFSPLLDLDSDLAWITTSSVVLLSF